MGGFSFGQPQQQQQPQPGQVPSLFGQNQNQNQNQNQAQNGLQNPGFGVNLNASTSAQQAMISSAAMQQSQIRAPWDSGNGITLTIPCLQKEIEPRKLFEDVEEKDRDLSSFILALQSALEDQKKIRRGIDGKSMAEKLMRDRDEIRVMEIQMGAYIDALTKLKQQVDRLNDAVRENHEVFSRCMDALQNAKNGSVHGGSESSQDKEFYVEYFEKLAKTLQDQMKRYKQVLSVSDRPLHR